MSALQGSTVPVPVTRALCDDVSVIGAPFYVMDRVEGRVVRSTTELAGFETADARRGVPRPRRRARPPARHRLRRGRPRGVRTTRRLPRPQRRPLGQAVAGEQDPRAPGDRRARPPDRRRAARVGTAGDRARRLPAREHDARRPTGPRSWPCSTGRCRRSATRSPTSACSSCTGCTGTPATRPTARCARDRRRLGPARLHQPRGRSSSGTPSQTGRDLANLDFYIVFAFYKLAVILEGINARFLMGKTLG